MVMGQKPSTIKEATSVAAHQEMVLYMVFRKAKVEQRNPSSQPVTASKYVAPNLFLHSKESHVAVLLRSSSSAINVKGRGSHPGHQCQNPNMHSIED